MTLYEFNRLSETDQLSAVWERSQYVVSRREGPYLMNLYAIDAFWVEVRPTPWPESNNGVSGLSEHSGLSALSIGF
jgi:hypothetical protein